MTTDDKEQLRLQIAKLSVGLGDLLLIRPAPGEDGKRSILTNIERCHLSESVRKCVGDDVRFMIIDGNIDVDLVEDGDLFAMRPAQGLSPKEREQIVDDIQEFYRGSGTGLDSPIQIDSARMSVVPATVPATDLAANEPVKEPESWRDRPPLL